MSNKYHSSIFLYPDFSYTFMAGRGFLFGEKVGPLSFWGKLHPHFDGLIFPAPVSADYI